MRVIGWMMMAAVCLNAAESVPTKFWGEFFILGEQTEQDDQTQNSEAAALGGRLGVEAYGSSGLYLGLEMFSLELANGGENPRLSSLADEEGRGFSALTEGFVGLKDGDHRLKIGRQIIRTPLLNTDAAHYLPYAYSGASYAYDDGAWRVQVGHVTHMRGATERYFEKVSASGEMAEGISYAGWESPAWYGLSHTLYYYRAEGLYDALFLQIDGSWAVGEKTYILAGFQNIRTYEDGGEAIDPLRQEGGDDILVEAARIGVWYEGAGLLAAYSHNSGADGAGRMYGGRAALFTDNMLHLPSTLLGSPKILSIRFKAGEEEGFSLQINRNKTSYDDESAAPWGKATAWYANLSYRQEKSALLLEGERSRFAVSGYDQTTLRVRLIQGF